MARFDYAKDIPSTKWLVEGLIPLGMMGFVIAQAGVGKSFWGGDLATSITFGQPFMGLKTMASNVMIIDQESPQDTFETRLKGFGQYYISQGLEQVGELDTHNMEGYSFKGEKNGSLKIADLINEHPEVKLVIIDALTTASTGTDLNKDVAMIAKFKESCIRQDLTILIIHHISEKKDLPVDALMTEDTHNLAMYASSLNQQADFYFVIASPDTDGTLKQLYIRPVSKRITIKVKPFITDLIEDKEAGTLHFNSSRLYQPEDMVNETEVEADIIEFFKSQTKKSEHTVKDVYTGMCEAHGIVAIRDAMNKLYRPKGILVRGKGAHNLFKFSLSASTIEEEVSK